MKKSDGAGDQFDGSDWVNSHSTVSSASQQYTPPTWMKLTTSSNENETEENEFFHFSHQPNTLGWNTSSADFLQGETDAPDTEEVVDDIVLGKSYDMFENRLRDGFLEAPNLGLTCAPPAMFEYQPPLHRIDLKDNKIELLPEQFFDELPMLRWCDLRYNRLQSLPSMSKEQKNLLTLLLQDNQISELPYSLAYAVNLQTLGWTNNCILEPPRHVLLEGCPSIMQYLRQQLTQRLPLDNEGNPIDLPTNANSKEGLDNGKKLKAKRSTSRCSISSSSSRKSLSEEEREKVQEQKRIDRIKYTWGLWQSIPYHGVSSQTLFEKSLQEVKDEVEGRLRQKREAILQKMKDVETVNKWRRDTRVMQLQGSTKPYNGVDAPFGTDVDVQPDNNSQKSVAPENFAFVLKDCMKKLQSFSECPVPLENTEEALKRLKEVEDIQRKIFSMKMDWSVKSSGPI